jgi:hypothetical protein
MFNPTLIVIEAFIRELRFFWKTVRPYIGDALRYLRIAQEGKQGISNLYANVFSMEHRSQTL